MDKSIAEIAEGLSENERRCVLAYSRAHDEGYLFAHVYADKGVRIDAAYAADLLRVNQTGEGLWRMRRDSLNQHAYALTPLGLAVRKRLNGE